MISFDSKMDQLKRFLIDLMRPSIMEYLHWGNPVKFEKWKNNCCRQISLITNWYLRDWLLNNSSGYLEIQSWEGMFQDKIGGSVVEYDHAWVYCVHQDPDKNLLIDISRTHKPSVFHFTRINVYPDLLPEYRNMTCLYKTRMDEKYNWDQVEYFSGKTIRAIVPKISRYLQRQSVLTNCLAPVKMVSSV